MKAKIEKKSDRAKAMDKLASESPAMTPEKLAKSVKDKTKNTVAKTKAKTPPKEKTKSTGDAPFRPGSKTDYVLSLLRKGITFPDLRSKLEKKYGEKTANEKNARMYLNNIREKIEINRKGDLYIAK